MTKKSLKLRRLRRIARHALFPKIVKTLVNIDRTDHPLFVGMRRKEDHDAEKIVTVLNPYTGEEVAIKLDRWVPNNLRRQSQEEWDAQYFNTPAVIQKDHGRGTDSDHAPSGEPS